MCVQNELAAMLDVLGATLNTQEAEALFRDAKEDFRAWITSHGQGVTLPEEMGYEKKDVGHVDDGAHGTQRLHARLAIDKKNRTVMRAVHAIEEATPGIVKKPFEFGVDAAQFILKA